MASAAEGEELLGLGRKAGNHGKVSFSRVSFFLGREKGKFEIFKRFFHEFVASNILRS